MVISSFCGRLLITTPSMSRNIAFQRCGSCTADCACPCAVCRPIRRAGSDRRAFRCPAGGTCVRARHPEIAPLRRRRRRCSVSGRAAHRAARRRSAASPPGEAAVDRRPVRQTVPLVAVEDVARNHATGLRVSRHHEVLDPVAGERPLPGFGAAPALARIASEARLTNASTASSSLGSVSAAVPGAAAM